MNFDILKDYIDDPKLETMYNFLNAYGKDQVHTSKEVFVYKRIMKLLEFHKTDIICSYRKNVEKLKTLK